MNEATRNDANAGEVGDSRPALSASADVAAAGEDQVGMPGGHPDTIAAGSELAAEAAGVYQFLMVLAIVRMHGLSRSARRLDCLRLPSPLFEEFCRRLLDRATSIEATSAWLQSQTAAGEGIARSSVFRFAAALFKQFDLAWKSYAAGGPKGAK